MYLLVVEGRPVMDSRDIATLTKKQHSHVMRDIRDMQEKVKDASVFGGIYLDKYWREKPLFKLPYRETILLLTGYSVELRAKVIDRWIELEKKQKSIREESKKTRNQFTDMLKEHGYTKRGHYIQTTMQMKETLGITAEKKNMNELELKKVRAAEAMADLLIDEQSGYNEVNPVCVNSCQIVIENKARTMIKWAIQKNTIGLNSSETFSSVMI
jgi:phage regulator Rha-like protein